MIYNDQEILPLSEPEIQMVRSWALAGIPTGPIVTLQLIETIYKLQQLIETVYKLQEESANGDKES